VFQIHANEIIWQFSADILVPTAENSASIRFAKGYQAADALQKSMSGVGPLTVQVQQALGSTHIAS
jgi:hypothetical protein